MKRGHGHFAVDGTARPSTPQGSNCTSNSGIQLFDVFWDRHAVQLSQQSGRGRSTAGV